MEVLGSYIDFFCIIGLESGPLKIWQTLLYLFVLTWAIILKEAEYYHKTYEAPTLSSKGIVLSAHS